MGYWSTYDTCFVCDKGFFDCTCMEEMEKEKMDKEQKIINSKWVDYDKYDRRTWPQIQDGSRLALCEDEEGVLHLSGFYNNNDPEWGAKSMCENIEVIRYCDVDAFRYLLNVPQQTKDLK